MATQIDKGIEVEQEHEGTYNWLIDYITTNDDFPELSDFAKHIAQDHIAENPEYYTLLKKAGL